MAVSRVPQSSSGSPLAEALADLAVNPVPIIGLLNHVPDALVWIKDSRGHFRWVNTAFVVGTRFGSLEQVIGKTDRDLCPASAASQFERDDAMVLRGRPVHARIELVVINHIGRWHVTHKIPLYNAQGQVAGTAGISMPLPPSEQVRQIDTPLAKSIFHIAEHFRETISNATLARLCGMSPATFQRRFRATYLCSPHQYIRELRLRLSCEALVFSKNSIAVVATEHGFSDQSHFTREFRRLFGETPRLYRRRHAG